MIIKTLMIIFILMFFKTSFSNNIGKETGLNLPRYVSLKSMEANLRVGPSKNYPIILKYIVNDYPLIIIDEYMNWRKIIDFQKNEGWIHKSLLKGERNAIVLRDDNKNSKLYNVIEGKVIGEITNNLIVKLNKCKLNWCFISKDNYKGWIRQKYLWGVNTNEQFNNAFYDKLYDFYFKSTNAIEKYFLINFTKNESE